MCKKFIPLLFRPNRWGTTLGLLLLCGGCAIKVGNPHTGTSNDADSDPKKEAPTSSDVLTSSKLTCTVLPASAAASTEVKVGCTVYAADGTPVPINSLSTATDWSLKPTDPAGDISYDKSADPSGKYHVIFTVKGKDRGTILQTIDASQVSANATPSDKASPVVIHGGVGKNEQLAAPSPDSATGYHYYRLVVDKFNNGIPHGPIGKVSFQYGNAWHQKGSGWLFNRHAAGFAIVPNGKGSHVSGETSHVNGNGFDQHDMAMHQNPTANNQDAEADGHDETADDAHDYFFVDKIVITGYIIEGADKVEGCPIAYHLEASADGKSYNPVPGSNGDKPSCKGNPQTYTFTP